MVGCRSIDIELYKNFYAKLGVQIWATLAASSRDTIVITNLLTGFEVCTVSCGPSFFSLLRLGDTLMGKRGFITYSTDWENEVIKIFTICLRLTQPARKKPS